MKKLLTFVSTWALFATFLIILAPQQASAASTLTTCTSLKSSVQYLAREGKCNERIYESATWYQSERVPQGTPGSKRISINTCQSKTRADLILLRAKCNPKTQITTTWHRPLGPPAAPSIVTISAGSLGTATVGTKAPADDGGARITTYSLTASPTAAEGKTERVNSIFNPNASGEIKISGLTPGATYTFTLIAHNAVGASTSSQASAPFLAPTVPASPSISTVITTGTNSALITYSAPTFDGGSPITSYTATSIPGGVQTTAYRLSSGTIDVSGLAPSTSYTFTIVANNFAGPSLPSTASAVITTLTPPPPAPAPSVEAPAPNPTVEKILPTFFPWNNLSKPALAGDFLLTAPVVIGSLAGALAYSSDSTGVITISGSTAHVVAEGTSVITATFTPTNTAAYSSATTTMTITVTAGDYTVGMDGPGGGKVFYVSASLFLCGPTQTAYCKFLESAATTGSGAWTDNFYVWSGNTSDWIGTTTTAIGSGYKNTLAMIAQSNTASRAGTIAQAFIGGGLSDWYLPSTDELNQMCKWAFGNAWTSDATLCSGGTLNLGTGAGLGAAGFIEYYYWSSSEHSEPLPGSVWDHDFNKSGLKDYGYKYSTEVVRPIRAFA